MKKLPKVIVFLLVVLLSLSSFTACGKFDYVGGTLNGGTVNEDAEESPEEILSGMDIDFSDSFNKDVVKKIDDEKLSGEVSVIIKLSDESLLTVYNESNDGYDSVSAFGSSARAVKYLDSARSRRDNFLARLSASGLISEVEYTYSTVLDGVCVSTTYENVKELSEFAGVSDIFISNTYEPCKTVTNTVNVQDTGIFDSSDVPYTGKGTIVAILDTGCDYTHTAFTSHRVEEPRYDKDDIENILNKTVAYGYDNSIAARDVYYGNVTKGKIAFGYDYADKDPDIMPFEQAHGTHVAGIIGGSDSRITGVAVDAQLAIMKVFSDYDTGADDGVILAALEDSVNLDVDAINMSLGMSAGFTDERHDAEKSRIYQAINDAGISLIVAASNDYSSAFGSEAGNTNKTRNPDSATVGSPSTYTAALSVASINGLKDKFMVSDTGREIFFQESRNLSGKEYSFFEMIYSSLGVDESKSITLEYVTISGVGKPINYAGLDMSGKIALVRRGDISFEDKVRYAHEAGAVAAIIYNNISGDIFMNVGNSPRLPVISIAKDDGVALAAKERGKLVINLSNEAGPFMSDFSSWGPSPDLRLKPEITAHGGNITSAVPGGGYDSLSGTSMAAPNMCGIAILIRQYVQEKFPDYDHVQVRDMVNRLSMSTATIALNRVGNPYSPRKQGAGLASLYNAVNTNAYLYVDGINTTKLELGDDPERTGVYEMSFNLCNMSDKTVSYNIDDFTMTESVSSSDDEFVAEMAYMLNNDTSYKVEGGTLKGSTVSVAAFETAKISVTITLTQKDKVYLKSNFENGMYVEGYITLKHTDRNGLDLSVPYLAFYGDWADAPIFDETFYNVESEAHNGAIDEKDKIKADLYATTPYGRYYYDYMIPLGSYVYNIDMNKYTAIPATEEHAAISYFKDSISGIFGVMAGLLRGAKKLEIEMINTATGEVVWTNTEYNCYKAFGSRGYYSEFELDAVDIGENNMHFKVTMRAALDWDGDKRNSNDTYEFSFYIDYEPPTVTNSVFRTEYDKNKKQNRYYVDLTVTDNHYAMAVRPVIIYSYTDSEGKETRTYTALSNEAIPVYQQTRGGEALVTVEITDYLDEIKESDLPNGIVFNIDDYALNSSVCYVPFPNTDSDSLSFTQNEINLDINGTADLLSYLTNGDENADMTYIGNLAWKSSNENVVIVDGGKIEAVGSGTAKVSFNWTDASGVSHTAAITVNVSENTVNNPDSGLNASVEKLYFSHYETLFAFTGDIDRSEIGKSGSTNYFDGKYELSFYPSEKIRLHYALKPWNLDSSRYTMKYSSSNARVASVNQNGVVTGESKGRATITLEIILDGTTSVLRARLVVEIKSEFIVENNELVAYKGKGGDVVIPDDLGIMYIGSFAFCHYNMVNDKEVEDEDDPDAKKEPLTNSTVTSVTIPDDVEEIRKFAFYNCTALVKVNLPSSLKRILDYVFYGDISLATINLDNVMVIGTQAFTNCERLRTVNLKNVNSIGAAAFSGTAITYADLTSLKWCGERAFAGVTSSQSDTFVANPCVRLTEIKVGPFTQLSKGMFDGCISLTTISGTLSVDQVPDRAFASCNRLRSVTFEGNLTYIGAEAFASSGLSSVTFKGECEYIADNAFAATASLRNFTLPEGEVVFGNMVFQSSGLETITFGKTSRIADMGVGMFTTSSSSTETPFKGFVATASDYYNTDEKGILYSKDYKTLVLAPPGANLGDFLLPATVEVIGPGAFTNNKLTSFSVEQGSRLVSIENSAFSGCLALASVTLPDSCKRIGSYAFFSTSALKTFKGDGVEYYGDYSFYGTGLTSVTINAGATTGESAFGECKELAEVTIGANATLGEGSFMNCAALTTVNMPEGEASVTLVGANFFGCVKLENIDITRVKGGVGYATFYNCKSLVSVNLGDIVMVGDYAFAGCAGITEIIMNKVVYIGAEAFTGTKNSDAIKVTSLNLPEVQYIGAGAFDSLTALVSVNMPKIVEIAPGSAYTTQAGGTYFIGAFSNCKELTTVELNVDGFVNSQGEQMPALESLADCVFYNCKKLVNIELSKVKHIGIMALGGSALDELTLDSLERISMYAFILRGETNNTLKSVSAPKLAVIEDGAFAGCAALSSVEFPSLVSIGDSAFDSCAALTSFTVSDSFKSVGIAAFNGAEALTAFKYVKDGVDSDTVKTDNFVLDKGVLYTVMPNGKYLLAAYPEAKADETYEVIEGTVRIGFAAAMNNKNIKKVILPDTLTHIGNMAFYKCTSLSEVEFRSYYAPQLEGSMSIETNINSDNIGDYEKWESLYKYSFYLRIQGQVSPYDVRYYQNFADTVTSTAASHLKYVYPELSSGYTQPLYRAYFNDKLDNDGNRVVSSGVTHGAYAVAFINACAQLPRDSATRFDSQAILNARSAYNVLLRYAQELATVDKDIIDNFLRLEKMYNADVVVYAISNIFEVDNCEYTYNAIRDAWLAYGELTSEEKALVTNSAVLDSLVAELGKLMPGEFDLNKEYSEYDFPTEKEKDGGCGCGSEADATSAAIGFVMVCMASAVCILVGRKRRFRER